jgi:hypothetical protein
MAKLISNDAQLRQYLPNVQITVTGETELFDKLSSYLDLAEQWVKENFTAESPFNTIAGYSDSNVTKTILSHIVVCEAFLNAIPALDLILTANGFGVVSSTNIAPASKQRVDRLIGEMETLRDSDILLLIKQLPGVSKWKTTDRFTWFSETLFPNIDVVEAAGFNANRWEKYLELRPQIMNIEQSLAEDFFSEELLKSLREKQLSGTLAEYERNIVTNLRSQIIDVIRGGTINIRKMIAIVNFIRINPDVFPEWHSSDTAKLFAPPIFRNKKDATGYFF